MISNFTPFARPTLTATVLAAFGLHCATVVAAPSLEEPSAAVVSASFRDGRLTLEARDAPLEDVVRRVGTEAGFAVTLSGDFNTPVNRTFLDRPLEETIRRLLHGAVVVMVYGPTPEDETKPRLKELWAYAASGAGRSSRAQGNAPAPPNRKFLGDLDSTDAAARRRAVDALVLREDEAAIPTLHRMLMEEPNVTVRRHVAQSLGALTSPRSVDALMTAVSDEDVGVRQRAIRALGRLSAPAAVHALGEVLHNAPDRKTRLAAASALGRQSSEEAISYLQAAASDPDILVRKAARQNLSKSE